MDTEQGIELLNVAEVCVLLCGKSAQTVTNWRKERGFPEPVGTNRRKRYNKAAVVAWCIDNGEPFQK